jgi:lipopolysaccharide transport system permease protein
MIGVALTLIAAFVSSGTVSTTVWMFPLVCVPLYAMCLGVSWFLSSLSVFLQDVRQIVGVVTSLLMFCSGVFYPVERIPANVRFLVEYNPLYVLIDSSRRTLLWSEHPEWLKLGVVTVGALALMQLGYAFFAKSKRGMADVV